MRIKLMADYGCWPLWHDGGDEVGNIDPQSLPLSAELIGDLNAWAAKLDAGLDWNDPAHTQWPEGFFAEFHRQGRALADRLRGELGPTFQVADYVRGQ